MNRKKQIAMRNHSKAKSQRKALILTFFGVFLVVVSFLVILRGQKAAPSLASADVVARGEQLYAENCAACHGANGEGHVLPEAPALNNMEHAWHHADGQLQRTILEGGQIMPPFHDKLSAEEAASIVRYVQTWWQAGQLSSQQSVSASDPMQ